MSPQKNQSGEIVRSVWKQLFVKYGLCNSQWVEIIGIIFLTRDPAANSEDINAELSQNLFQVFFSIKESNKSRRD